MAAATTSAPFRNIPPAIASIPKLPGLPLLGNLLEFRRDRLGLQQRASDLAPIGRVQIASVPLYITADADVAHEILVEHADAFHKSQGIKLMMPLLGDGLLLSEGDVHKRHRKLLAGAFAPKRLAAYGETMVAETETQLRGWRAGRRIDLATEMMQMTLAIAGRTLFSADVRGDAAVVGEGMELAMRATIAGLLSPLRVPITWPLPRNLRMKRAVAMLDEVVYRLIAEGRARGTDRGDVLSILLLARDDEDGTGLTDKQVRDETMTLLLAGHETTANTLAWTWHHLGSHPAVHARLVEELARLGDRPVTVDDLPALPWNLAVLEESMRLSPPVFLTGREATRDVVIGGHHLPKGAMIAVNIRGIHRRADYYPDPLAFRPERMLPDAKKARPRHHYLPFGAGPRVCIGSHFAMLEAQLALATMARRARVRMLKSDVTPEPLITLRPRGGLPAIVEAV
jgi:cytochrome P450